MNRRYRGVLGLIVFALLCVGLAGCFILANLRPEASFTATWTLGETSPLDVSFDASASSDPDGVIVGYLWDFGDAQTPSTTALTTHTFVTQSVSRVFTVVLIVTDDDGATDTAVRNIPVDPHP